MIVIILLLFGLRTFAINVLFELSTHLQLLLSSALVVVLYCILFGNTFKDPCMVMFKFNLRFNLMNCIGNEITHGEKF